MLLVSSEFERVQRSVYLNVDLQSLCHNVTVLRNCCSNKDIGKYSRCIDMFLLAHIFVFPFGWDRDGVKYTQWNTKYYKYNYTDTD